jgi:hypothetical protein
MGSLRIRRALERFHSNTIDLALPGFTQMIPQSSPSNARFDKLPAVVGRLPYAWCFPPITSEDREQIEAFASQGKFASISQSIAYIISRDFISSLRKVTKSNINYDCSVLQALEASTVRIPDFTKYDRIFYPVACLCLPSY